MALWGVLKAGGAYLPLDPQLPAGRLRFTLEDARVEVIVTQQDLRHDLPEGPQHVICLDGGSGGDRNVPHRATPATGRRQPSGLCHLYVGLHGPTQGRNDRAPGRW